jgi:hypothetical protein
MQASDFNCTKYAGICKPTTATALAVVQECQRQLNRVAQLKGLAKITVDGDVGPKMLALAKATLGVTGDVTALALGCDAISVMAATMATSNGVPATVSQPKPIVQPSYLPPGAPAPIAVASAGGMIPPLFGLSSTQTLMVLGVGGLIVYKKFFSKKRK